ncbi:MAG: Mercuric resistance operon regulatory protein [Myxococcaceae bacterium]|nr:Mercuric resistance operon regulatory protein [Myxococcaceae bacterium]
MSTVRLPLLHDAAQLESVDADGVDARDDKQDGSSPNVALMQVGDLARESGKTVRAIHLYEELDLLLPAARSKGRYRLYDRDALTRIRWIGKLQDMGFSLTDIQTIVKDWQESGSAPRAMVKMREVYKNRLAQTREHIQRLESLRTELEASLDYLDTCEVCDPDRLLTACRACDLHDCEGHVPELVAGFRANNPKDVH